MASDSKVHHKLTVQRNQNFQNLSIQLHKMTSKKQITEKNQPAITSFLQTKNNQKILEEKNTNNVDRFMNEKSESVFNSSNTGSELDSLCSQYAEKLKVQDVKLKHAMQLLKESAKVNLEKDLKIKMLKNQLKEKNLIFAAFETKIGEKNITFLRSVKSGEKNDSTFVYHLMQILYESCEDTLQNKSATGKKFKGVSKEPLSPEKKSLINSMLIERIANEKCDPESRIKKLNTHIKSAIKNINKKRRVDEKYEEISADLGSSTVPTTIQQTIYQENYAYGQFHENPSVFGEALTDLGPKMPIYHENYTYGQFYENRGMFIEPQSSPTISNESMTSKQYLNL